MSRLQNSNRSAGIFQVLQCKSVMQLVVFDSVMIYKNLSELLCFFSEARGMRLVLSTLFLNSTGP